MEKEITLKIINNSCSGADYQARRFRLKIPGHTFKDNPLIVPVPADAADKVIEHFGRKYPAIFITKIREKIVGQGSTTKDSDMPLPGIGATATAIKEPVVEVIEDDPPLPGDAFLAETDKKPEDKAKPAAKGKAKAKKE